MLKQQRYNERKIRKIKSEIKIQEDIISQLPSNTPEWLRTKYANDLHLSKI